MFYRVRYKQVAKATKTTDILDTGDIYLAVGLSSSRVLSSRHGLSSRRELSSGRGSSRRGLSSRRVLLRCRRLSSRRTIEPSRTIELSRTIVQSRTIEQSDHRYVPLPQCRMSSLAHGFSIEPQTQMQSYFLKIRYLPEDLRFLSSFQFFFSISQI